MTLRLTLCRQEMIKPGLDSVLDQTVGGDLVGRDAELDHRRRFQGMGARDEAARPGRMVADLIGLRGIVLQARHDRKIGPQRLEGA